MANTTEFIWYQSPEIWAAIVAGIFALVTTIGTVLLYKKKNSIETQFAETLEEKKAELERTTYELNEKLRIEYGSLYQQRIDVIKELYFQIGEIKRIEYDIDEQIGRYQSNGDFHYLGSDNLSSLVRDLLEVFELIEKIFSKSKIYFSSEDSLLIEGIVTKCRNFKRAYDYFKEHEEGYDLDDKNTYTIECFIEREFTSLFGGELNELIVNIENRFRYLVGVK